ncbi:hypothetical protein LX36DRAFT_193309 [Colletotrichum falcatum]|nr:hypothetical protein LX36DRAFT_193309 [Colletotrichum falcatum]
MPYRRRSPSAPSSPPLPSSSLSPSPPPRRGGPCQTWSLLDWVNQQERATQVPRTVPQSVLAFRLFGHWLVQRSKSTQYEKKGCRQYAPSGVGGYIPRITQIPLDPIARTTVSRYAQLSTLRASVQHTPTAFYCLCGAQPDPKSPACAGHRPVDLQCPPSSFLSSAHEPCFQDQFHRGRTRLGAVSPSPSYVPAPDTVY